MAIGEEAAIWIAASANCAPLCSLRSVRLVMQNDVQQRAVDFQVAVVINQAQFSELIHEKARARSHGSPRAFPGLLPRDARLPSRKRRAAVAAACGPHDRLKKTPAEAGVSLRETFELRPITGASIVLEDLPVVIPIPVRRVVFRRAFEFLIGDIQLVTAEPFVIF
jgi:hypothetical protein